MENKQKRGRPSKEKEKLTRSMNVKFTEDGYAKVANKAARLGLPPTRYTREVALNGKVNSPYTPEELDLMRKIASVANNVNQIAKKANTAGFYSVKNEAMQIIN